MALWQASTICSSVLGFEARTPAHPRTAVGGDTRLFRMTYRGTDPYYPILQQSLQLWGQLEEESGRAILGRCGGLSIGHRDGRYIPALLESIRACGADHDVLDHDQMRQRYPQHNLDPDEVGVWDPHAGYLKTDTAVLSAVECAEKHGATVLTDSPVTAVTETDDGVRVESADRSWTVDRVIVTGGAWATRLLPERLRENVYPTRILLTWFEARDPELFAPEVFPIFIHIAQGTSMYGAPSLDGTTVKASLDGRAGRAHDPDDLLRVPTEAEMTEVRQTAASYFPDLIPYVVRADTYPDLYTTDGIPLLGFAPGSRRIVLATGFSGAGFKMASGFGAIAASLALDPDRAAAPSFTDPARFA
ncbi:FAD-dependent oxidoreductase [Flexivirga caeni]|uniref:FAD-dependent oxidoreductase n=2 Tax=Flexivirga caeni TaxID=2294115 RepID=A0A3M9M5W3_9MICO|nr:FAD-dependent oxidoreductase [Flexivirga caeni]